MKFEECVAIEAPIAKVFAMYADVGNWKTWDPDVKSSTIEGPFVSGSLGTLRPTRGPKAKIVFKEVVTNSSFTVESKLPLCVMRFEHELSEMNGETQALHRVIFEGVLSPVFGRLIGRQIKKGLPHTLEGLKRAVEM
jgi:hypothetical protein